MTKHLHYWLITILILISLFAISSAVLAQNIGLNNVNDIANKAGIQTNTGSDVNALATTVGEILALICGLLGVIFLGLVIYAGFQWMTAGGNEEKVTQARGRVTSGVIGLAIVLLAYTISMAVIGFYYKQTGRGAFTANFQGNGDYIKCEHNSDCPQDMPICDPSYATRASTSPAGFLGIRWGGGGSKNCTCLNNTDCTGVPGKTKCGEISLGINRCVECNVTADCQTSNYRNFAGCANANSDDECVCKTKILSSLSGDYFTCQRINRCHTDNDCSSRYANLPYCKTSTNVCVECRTAADCRAQGNWLCIGNYCVVTKP